MLFHFIHVLIKCHLLREIVSLNSTATPLSALLPIVLLALTSYMSLSMHLAQPLSCALQDGQPQTACEPQEAGILPHPRVLEVRMVALPGPGCRAICLAWQLSFTQPFPPA